MKDKKCIILVIGKELELFNIISQFTKNLEHKNIENIYCNEYDYSNTLKNITPDIVFIDELNSDTIIKIIKYIRSEKKKNNIYIIVGIGDEDENLSLYVNSGANDYVVKPYKANRINVRITSILELIDERKSANLRKIQFNTLLNSIPYMAWFKDENSNYIKVNNDFVEHSGKEFENIKGKDDIFVWDGKIGDECKEYDLEVMNTRKKKIFNQIIPGKNGYREFNIHKSPVINEYDEVIGTIGIAKDITELKNNETKLNTILENIPFAVWLKNKEGKILKANKKYLEHFNITELSISGKEENIFLNDEEYKLIKKTDEQIIEKKCGTVYERNLKNDKYSEERIFEVYKSPILDISNEVIGIVGLFRDITEVKRAQEEVERLAYIDVLTQLPNRRALYTYLDRITKDNYKSIAIMFIDLDNFKKLNDTYGHNYGDKALIMMANKLKILCKDIFIARMGGDEFVLVCIDKNEEYLKQVAENIILQMKTEFNKEDKFNEISVSAGVVIEKNKNATVEKLLINADIALYKAKEMGKNQYVVYTEELERVELLKREIEKGLINAVKNKEIKLYYQPQYSSNGLVKGFEALFRWENIKYSKVPVIKIIEIIEKSHLINIVGDYIINEACRFAKEINSISAYNIPVSINISAVQIMNNNFVENLKNIINKNCVLPSNICIEITETVLLDNIDENVKKLKEIMDFGINVSLDDFGIGYSSLNYLVKLPLSQVKIDRSFIVGMNTGREYRTLVRLIIEAVHSLKLPVVAEGVESEEELEMLKVMDVDYIQGYVFSKPLPEKDAKKLIIN